MNENHAVTGAVKKLAELVEASKTPAEYLEQLEIIKTECDKGMQYRVLAGELFKFFPAFRMFKNFR